MPFELEQWLNDLAKQGDLTPEELAGLKPVLSKPGATKFLEESTLRQADYSRRQNEVSEKERQTLALQNQLIDWKKTAEQKVQEATGTAKQKQAALDVIAAKVREKASEYGLDPAEILPADASVTPTGTTTTTPQNPITDYLRKEDWNKDLESIRKQFPMLPAALMDLQVQHQKLFGGPLENSSAIVAKAMQVGKPIQEVWEEEFKVEDRRKQIQEQQIQDRVNAAVAEKERQLRSELQLPTPRPDQAHSPVLTKFQSGGSDQKRPEMSAAEVAAAAFNEGKYRQGNAA